MRATTRSRVPHAQTQKLNLLASNFTHVGQTRETACMYTAELSAYWAGSPSPRAVNAVPLFCPVQQPRTGRRRLELPAAAQVSAERSAPERLQRPGPYRSCSGDALGKETPCEALGTVKSRFFVNEVAFLSTFKRSTREGRARPFELSI